MLLWALIDEELSECGTWHSKGLLKCIKESEANSVKWVLLEYQDLEVTWGCIEQFIHNYDRAESL